MTETVSRDDLTYLKDLAVAGAEAPQLGGRFLAWWGGVVTLAYGLHFLMVTGQLGLTPQMLGVMWITFLVIALGGYALLCVLRPQNKPGQASAGNRASIVWAAAGFSIFAFFIGLQFAGAGMESPWLMYNFSLPLVFAVYACALMVTGALSKSRILVVGALIAILTVAATTARVAHADAYIIGAVGAFFCAFVPGVVLFANEPRSTV